jgi:hypothetical protein
MLARDLRCSRRKFLASTAALTLGGAVAPRTAAARTSGQARKPIAVLGSVYRPLSYLYHVAGRFLHGYPQDGQIRYPSHRIATLWVDQVPENDLSREIGRKFDIRCARTIRDALMEQDRLAVDGVLIVAEHGNYPRNEYGQILYPRAAIFKEVAQTFRTTGRSVPVFVAKHLSYSFAQAAEMVQTAATIGFPLMAGSAVPTARKVPEIPVEPVAPIREALVAAYGPIEVFGFDALEALQSLVERRAGGESGVIAVQCLSGPEVWRAGNRGGWSWELLHAALARGENVNLGDPRDNVGSIALPTMPATPPIAFVIEYSDGLRGTVLLLNGHLQDFVAAVRVGDSPEILGSRFAVGAAPGMNHFNSHVEAIDQFLSGAQQISPVQRTLLTTGILERLLESHAAAGRRIETPELALSY